MLASALDNKVHIFWVRMRAQERVHRYQSHAYEHDGLRLQTSSVSFDLPGSVGLRVAVACARVAGNRRFWYGSGPFCDSVASAFGYAHAHHLLRPDVLHAWLLQGSTERAALSGDFSLKSDLLGGNDLCGTLKEEEEEEEAAAKICTMG